MVNFILCEDEKSNRNEIVEFLSKFMMHNEMPYKTHIFSDYDDNFIQIIKEKLPAKIYILDIETPTRSGIDIARLIRSCDDESIIIFLTGHEELGMTILKDEIMCLSLINKFDDYENRLTKVLNKSLSMISDKKTLKFKEKSIDYIIPFNNILYVTRDSVERKCIIKTDTGDVKTYKSFAEIIDKLDSRFIQTHRACVINKDRTIKVNYSKKIILFDNGIKSDLLSLKYRKELKKYVKNN